MKTLKRTLQHFVALSVLALPLMAGAQSSHLQDVSYRFDAIKVQAAEDSFHFLRSFVDLYYLIVQANQKNLSVFSNLSQTQGWCVGDAHAENFGVLLQEDQSPLFTMNDMDDSGPCPIGLDLLRLMVSSRLYNPNTKLDKIVEAYLEGLKNNKYQMPRSLREMLSKAVEKGSSPSDKKVQNQKILRDHEMSEISDLERTQILAILESYGRILKAPSELLDAVKTSKVGGGSGGLLRYEVLINNGGTLLLLEFKEEPTPAIYPVSSEIPSTDLRISNTLQITQGPMASKLYRVISLQGREMLIRPRFAGNLSVSLDGQSAHDNNDIIRYEAYTLGLIHSRSIGNLENWIHLVNSVSNKAWNNDVVSMADYFENKFKQVKHF